MTPVICKRGNNDEFILNFLNIPEFIARMSQRENISLEGIEYIHQAARPRASPSLLSSRC